MKYYSLTRNGLKVNNLDIKHTVESAQPLTFYADYDFSKGTIRYTNSTSLVDAKFKGRESICNVEFSENVTFAKRDFIRRFRLGDDMAGIYSRINTDSFMKAAITKYRGMRVTLNDPWETTLCFIISQYNNVKRIRRIVKAFVREFGKEICDENGAVIAKSFPTSEELAKLTERDFRNVGAGFRAKYIVKAADFCTNNIDLHRLQNKSYDKLKGALMEISGVGDKVADCIALMGYGNFEAFPVDVWVKRTMERVYFNSRNKKIKELHAFAEEKWGKYRGYAQQYIFWGGRMKRLNI